MIPELLETVLAQQVWIAERNFCTRQFLFGIVRRSSDFVIRQHKSLPVKEISPLEEMGQTKTGKVFEQQVQITNSDGSTLQCGRIRVQCRLSDGQRRKPRPNCDSATPTYKTWR